MVKITLADGMVIEGTAEELRELAEVFGEVAEAAEETPEESLVGKYVVFHEPKGTIKVGEYYEITGIREFLGKTFVEYAIDGDRKGDVTYPQSESVFKYEIVDEKPSVQAAPEPEETTQDVREGDYVVFNITTLDITKGKPYKIKYVYAGRDIFEIIDDAGDTHSFGTDGEESPYKLYRPVEGAPQVGDKILVVDATHAIGYYGNGDILTVTDYYFRGTVGKYVVNVDGEGPYLYREEFVIIERAERKPALEVGDKVRLIREGGQPCLYGFSKGDICMITTTNSGGRFPIGIDNGHVRGYVNPEDLEKV